ncbi:MAG: hypothetical protein M3335_04980, partial [Actinomycetota bacterium]|nr:hypothetical protein [Actinomycetota bacterium]
MDLEQLRIALKPFEDRPGGKLVVPAAGVAGWVSIRPLLEGSFAAETLTVGGISQFPPDAVAGAIVYRGQSTLFPWQAPAGGDAEQAAMEVTARFTVDVAGEPQLTIEAEPAKLPWRLADSVGDLSGTSLAPVFFESARIYLSSAGGTDSRYPGLLPVGVSLMGAIAPSGPFSRAGHLLATTSARTVVGSIVVKGTEQPLLELLPVASDPLDLDGLRFSFGARLRSEEKTFDDPEAPSWRFAAAEIVASLQTESGASLKLEMPLLPNGEVLGLRGGGQDLTGWSAIGSAVGVPEIERVLPDLLPPAAKVVLEELELQLDLGGQAAQRAMATVDVALHTPPWSVLPKGILTVTELGTRLTVDFTSADLTPAALVYGTVELAEAMPLQASISVPQLDLSIALDSDLPIDLADVLGGLLGKLTDATFEPPLAGMELARFEFGSSLRSGEFALRGAVLTPWEIPLDPSGTLKLARLKLEEVGFQLEYDGAALGVELAAQMSIASAMFYVSASTPGGADAGWTLGAGLQPQTQISVLDLMKELMFGEQPVPGADYGIPSIVITALAMSVSLDAKGAARAFEASGAATASWKPEVLGTKLQLSVAVQVAGSKPASGRNVVLEDGKWAIEGEVGGTFVLYGLAISAGYHFAELNSTLTFGVWYGDRGLEATVSKQLKDPSKPELGKDTMLAVRLGNLSLGEVLEYLVGLAVPGESRRLPPPWDVLYQVNFKDLSLLVNLTTKDIEVRDDLHLDLGFAEFDKVGLLYKRVNGEGRVNLQLSGEFLGQPFGKEGKEPLSWDVVNEEAPAVSGKGPTFLDLRY